MYDLDLQEDAEERPFNVRYFLRMLGYTRRYSKTAAAGVGLTLVGILIGLAEPMLLKTAIDQGVAAKNVEVVGRVLAVLVAFRLIQWVCSSRQIRIMNFLGQKILYDLRQELFEHIQRLPVSFFHRYPVGKIVSRLTNDVNHMSQLASSNTVNLLSQLVSLVGIVAIMVWAHWKMALLSFTTLPLLVLVMTKVRWSMEHAWGESRKAIGEINAHLNETVQGLQVIQAFGQEEENSRKFSKAGKKFFNAYMKAIKIEVAFWPLTDLVGALGTAIVVLYGSMELFRGTVSLGLMLAFVNYLGKFWAPISTFSRAWSQILSAMASAERVFGILDVPLETEGDETKMEMPRIQGEVVFENVSFHYRAGEPVLHNVSFRVRPGETIALVGPTGAGKTTIINLVAAFHRPTSGRVLVDGYDLAEVKLGSYRKQLGIVLQDTFIFSGTILDNIKFGKPDASMEEVERAAKASRAIEFISRMPKGFDSEVHERGQNLSTGERQLLAFTRALLADPRILILDEATSSIDPGTERLIQEAMQTLLKGRTSFIIAHRLATVRAADRIFVVQDGRIVEEGSHQELVNKGGLYARLYEAQFKTSRNKVRLNGDETNGRERVATGGTNSAGEMSSTN